MLTKMKTQISSQVRKEDSLFLPTQQHSSPASLKTIKHIACIVLAGLSYYTHHIVRFGVFWISAVQTNETCGMGNIVIATVQS